MTATIVFALQIGIVVFAMPSEFEKTENKNKVFPLPMTEIEAQKIGVNDRFKDLVKKSSLPSDYLKVNDDMRGEDVKWFLDALDSDFRVADILVVDGKTLYLGIASRNTKKPGRVFLQIDRVIGNLESSLDPIPDMEDSIIKVLKIMESSLDTEDISFQRFLSVGNHQSGLVDLSRSQKSEAIKWRDSWVVMGDVYGDNLLVTSSGETAWFQLETGLVVKAFPFKKQIIEYFRSVMNEVDFNSWTQSKLK